MLSGFLFYFLITLLILFAKNPIPSPFQQQLYQGLLAGKDPFARVGSNFSIFKPFLPPHDKVSFIMDFPFTPYVNAIDQFYAAQAYLTPTLLSHEPDQRAAIIYCSTTQIAEMRMQETGYRLLLPLAEGKGIAVKK